MEPTTSLTSRPPSLPLDWDRITAIVHLVLDRLPGDRSGAPDGAGGLGNDALSAEEVRRAFEDVELEFKRVLGPLRSQMRLLRPLLLLPVALLISGTGLSFFHPLGGAVLSVAGATAWFTLYRKIWQIDYEHAFIELIPIRYKLALQFCKTHSERKTVLNLFLKETAPFVQGKRKKGG
jgi:hypothetical protein